MAPQSIDSMLVNETTASTPSHQEGPKANSKAPDAQSIDDDILEPIAIIGFSFQFPGATDSNSLWQMMLDKRCAAKEAPKERMNVDGWYHPDSNRRGQFYSRSAHYLEEDISLFDAPFFSLSADEAAGMDPQQRLLLEATYRALENAGIPMENATSTRTSVHVGCFGNDYRNLMCKDVEMTADYDVLGAHVSMNANRLSWFFDFRGTSMNVDTACSSGLVALDLACQELLAGNTDMGVVAGSNLIMSPDVMLLLSNVNMLSPDGRSYSFDHRANGYGRGEGVATLIIKRLSDAIRDENMIRAVIRSTGSNQDGLTPSGIMQPNGDSQAALIRETYQKAGLSLEPTRFFEAHGTGTPVGDPIELNAVGSVFRTTRTAEDPLIVGALKSNIGHLEGASGIASVIKTVLVLEKGWIPPNTNFERLNHNIDLEFLKIKLPHEPLPWPTQGLRRASVNSFGFGGTNSHVILDDAFHFLKKYTIKCNHETVDNPPPSALPVVTMNGSLEGSFVPDNDKELEIPRLLTFAAHDKAGVKRLVDAYAAYFESSSVWRQQPFSNFISDLSYTLNVCRSSLPCKTFFLASGPAELQSVKDQTSSIYQALKKPTLAFVFTGQGAQWIGMGRQLARYSVFLRSITESGEYLQGLGCTWSLIDSIWNEGTLTNINAPDIAQPACTALQIALVDLLDSIGVRPVAVIGHSSGEIGAAYAYGALTKAEALKVAYYRGFCAAQLIETQERRGAMIAVGLSEPETRSYIEQVAKLHGNYGIEVAAINSQRSTTVSGESLQVDTLKALLDDNEIFARKLQIPLAYHSSHMLQIASEYRSLIGDLAPGGISKLHGNMMSSVTCEKVSADELRSPDYWVQNLISPVQFAKAFNQLCDDPKQVIRKKLDGSHRNYLGINIFLEIGPHAALQGPIKNLLEDMPWGQDVNYYATLRRGKQAIESFLHAVGPLYCLGCSVDLDKLGRLSGQKKARILTDLPQYPFDHSKSYWRESNISKNLRLGGHGKLDLVGKLTPDSNPMEKKWRNNIRISEMPWVEDHAIDGTVIYPAAGMLVMAIEAAKQMASQNKNVLGFEIKDITFSRALTVPNTAEGVETSFTVHSSRDILDSTDVWSEFRLCFFENDSWQESCHGFLRTEYETQANEVNQNHHRLDDCMRWDEMISQACDQKLEPDKLYNCLRDCGFQFGPTFQTLSEGTYSSFNHAQSLVKVFQWPDEQYPQPHVIHPTTLDGILHVTLSAASKGGCERLPTAIPTSIRKIWIAKDGLRSADNDAIKTMATANDIHNRGFDFNVYAMSPSQKQVLVKVDGLQSSIVAQHADSEESSGVKQPCYQLFHLPDPEMSSLSQMAQYCAKARTDSDRKLYFEALNFTLFKFLHQTLDALGDVVPETIPSHLKKYIEWAKLECRIFSDPNSPIPHPEWRELLHDPQYFEAACRLIESTSDQGKVFLSTGQNLLPILQGEVDPMEYLFKDDMMVKFYAEINNRPCFDEWDSLLRTYAHKNPDMKILEIGAGTGGTSRMILRTLSSGTDGIMEQSSYKTYDYTDISPAFFERAREDFSNFRNINFEVLDIEKEPATQGFEPHTYDLIIAANVLHATTNMHATLQNIRSLLKTDGKLMMYEITRPDVLRSGFIFGLLSGWWAGEQDGRLWNPGLTSGQWSSALKEAGFSGIDLEFPDYVDTVCQEAGILVSTAVEPKPGLETQPIENLYVIVDPASSQQLELYERIRLTILLECAPRSVAIEACDLEKCARLPDLSAATLIFIQETEAPLISNMSRETYEHIQKVVGICNKILFVTAGGGHSPKIPEYSLIDGWTRTLRNEKSSRYMVTLALDIPNDVITQTQISSIVKVLNDVLLSSNDDGYEAEFVEIDGLLHIPRARQNSDLTEKLYQESLPLQASTRSISNSGPLKLAIGTVGLLDTLHWREDDEPLKPLEEDEVEIEVKAVGLNFKDCLIALGRVPGTTLGQECSGIVTRAGKLSGLAPGDRVAGFGSYMFKTFVRCKTSFITKISDTMSFPDASSIPAQFGTAWQVVVEIGRLQRGESILIHAAAGGTGQAAIQIAQYVGAEVYATVGSKAKKQILMDEYCIPEDHIFFSRDTQFAQGIMLKTEGRGVDVIINSLAGEILRASWECIAPYGRFVEIGKKDILANNHLEMAQFGRNASFTHFDGSIWVYERPKDAKRCLETVYQLFEEGKLHVQRPLRIFNASEVEQALRHMQSGTAAGKIVIDMENEAQVQTILPKESFRLDPQATYVITGGLGGIGRTIARWMVTRGAKHLALLGRSGPKTEAAFSLLEELKGQGVAVFAPPCDLIDSESVRRVVQEISKNMPPIKGCIQGSMALRDMMFNEMGYEDWRVAVECKGIGSWNLEVNLPQDMDFFVMLSSLCGVFGLPGQANYATGNTYLDGYAKYRVANGRKAVSLDLGAMADEGLLVEKEGLLDKVLDYGALNPVTRQQFLGILDYYCNPKAALLAPHSSQLMFGMGDKIMEGRLGGIMRNNRMFRHVLSLKNDDMSGQGDNVRVDFQKQFSVAQSLQEGRQIVCQALVHKFTHSYKIIGQDTEVNKQVPLHTLGVDSLLAVEICNWIKREFLADIAVFEVLGGATLSSVDVLVANRSHVKHPKWQ